MTDWKIIAVPVKTHAELKALKKRWNRKSVHAVIDYLIAIESRR